MNGLIPVDMGSVVKCNWVKKYFTTQTVCMRCNTHPLASFSVINQFLFQHCFFVHSILDLDLANSSISTLTKSILTLL